MHVQEEVLVGVSVLMLAGQMMTMIAYTNFEPTKEIIINPPDEEWKAKAIKCIEEWSESTICTTVDIVERGGNIAPHRIVGDGHCLFRAISKAITGNQENHQLFRAAVVQWMLSERHPPQLAKYVGSVGENSVCSEVVREYIEMSHDTWGSDKEIRAFATMFQIVIYVSPGGRRWNEFSSNATVSVIPGAYNSSPGYIAYQSIPSCDIPIHTVM